MTTTATTPATVSSLYQQYQEWTQVMNVTHEGHVFEVFKRESSVDGSDSVSPIFRDQQYYLSWHVAGMLLTDGFYTILPYGEGWSAQFSQEQLGLLLGELKTLEGEIPWGLFLRKMNKFRVYREEDTIPFADRLSAIYLD